MLIVIVIIGILSVVLFPKFNGYFARTRDMKRYSDLRNIAAAVQMYRDSHGEFPKRKFIGRSYCYNCYFWSTSDIQGLNSYLTEIPRDPNKNQIIKIHKWPLRCENSMGCSHDGMQAKNFRWWDDWKGGAILMPWEYLYQFFKKMGMRNELQY